MQFKEKFILLKDTPNVISLSPSSLHTYTVPGDTQNLVRAIKLVQKQINHFTGKRVKELTEDIFTARKNISVVNIPKYPLPVSYSKSVDKIVINLNPLGVDEIAKVDYKVVYAALAYGICFRDIVTKKIKIKDMYAGPMVAFLNTMFVRLFGKEYGLLGVYSTKLPKLKFLLACYILSSFFDIKGDKAFRKASTASGYSYKAEIDKLKKYDFTRIDDFIKSLSDLKVMPGLSKVHFTKKILQFFGLNFLPALEDLARFISTITVSNISGGGIAPSFIYTYNAQEFNKLLEISKIIFR